MQYLRQIFFGDSVMECCKQERSWTPLYAQLFHVKIPICALFQSEILTFRPIVGSRVAQDSTERRLFSLALQNVFLSLLFWFLSEISTYKWAPIFPTRQFKPIDYPASLDGFPHFRGSPNRLRYELLEDHFYERTSPQKMHGMTRWIVYWSLKYLEGWRLDF